MATWTVSSLLATSSDYLARHGSSSARLDAELLLARVLDVDRIDLYLDGSRPLAAKEVDAYRELVRRRAKHEPIAYILGRAHFRYLELQVSPAVLIPRPETEELVDRAFEWLETHPLELCCEAEEEESHCSPPANDFRVVANSSVNAPPGNSSAGSTLVADVGVGSGAIALSMAAERGLRVLGLDSSEQALAVAAENRDRLGLADRVELRTADLLEGVADRSLRLVVSNPPYISDEEMTRLAPDVAQYEPAAALRGGPGGLDVICRLVPDALRVLSPGGRLLIEVSAGQSEAVVGLGLDAGLCCADVFADLSGKERIVGLSCPGAPTMPMSRAVKGSNLEALRRALRAGAVLGVPTDTVYGLAAAWDSGRGVRRLFGAKGRGEAKPVAVLFGSVASVRMLLPDLPPAIAAVLGEFLPGPFTFIVPTLVSRPELVGTPESLGVRVPGEPELLSFLSDLDVPLAASSANRSGQPDAAGPADVPPELAAACAVLLTSASGVRPGGVASTVVDLRSLDGERRWSLLREGAVPAAEVTRRMRALGF